jgi:hypothetical protein
MENEILDIAKKIYHNQLTPKSGTALLLYFFGVNKDGNEVLSDVSSSLLIPISTLKVWIDRLDSIEWSSNHRIYVKEDIEELVKNAEKQ